MHLKNVLVYPKRISFLNGFFSDSGKFPGVDSPAYLLRFAFCVARASELGSVISRQKESILINTIS